MNQQEFEKRMEALADNFLAANAAWVDGIDVLMNEAEKSDLDPDVCLSVLKKQAARVIVVSST